MPRYSVKTMKAGQRRWTDTGYHDPVTGYVRWDSLCMVRMFSEQESVQVLEQEGCKKKQGNEYDKGPECSPEAIFRGMDLSVKCFRYSPYTMRNAIADAMGAKTMAAQRKIRTIIMPPGHRHL
jgi:hypothetical protein